MPEAFSTPNLVALPITSQELGRGGLFCPPPTKIVISNSPTTIGLSKRCPTKETLCLKVGCRVMLLINMRNDNLVNGSIGTVVRIFNDLPC